MSNLTQVEKEKAETIIRLFGEISPNARHQVMGKLYNLKKEDTGGDNIMEVDLNG